MPSVQYLREFINERLTAAAEQIFLEFEKTIVQYEEEIDRQRRLLDITWKPQIKLHRTDVPQQPVCKEEEEVLPEQQLWNQERSSSVDQEEPEPPQIKEEQEELCSSQEGEQLGLKEEIHSFTVPCMYEESDDSESELLGQQLLSPSFPVAESEDHEGSKYRDLGVTENAEVKPKKRNHSENAENPTLPMSQCNTGTGNKYVSCDVCGKAFKKGYQMRIHQRIHTGEKPYSCTTCGKGFTQSGSLLSHMRTHTGEKPYLCNTCGKRFSQSSRLSIHTRIHTGEKPYLCKTCGKGFSDPSSVKQHKVVHTGEKPYLCNTCGKRFSQNSSLWAHMRSHTGEKPYFCKTCGKSFSQSSRLSSHTRIHTGEKPYPCKMCGKDFRSQYHLTVHMRNHSDSKPYPCNTPIIPQSSHTWANGPYLKKTGEELLFRYGKTRQQQTREEAPIADLSPPDSASPHSPAPLHTCLTSNTSIIKFIGNTAITGLITSKKEAAYREEVAQLLSWCLENYLSLNAKTKEMIIDPRIRRKQHAPLYIKRTRVERVKIFKFHSTHITAAATMPSVQYLREFINERLTAAAEQIFLEFEKTIVQYEEEIDRQRRLLDITWKPQIKLHRTDLQQQHVCEEEEVQQRSRTQSLQIKEEQEELCISQDGEQRAQKEETGTFMVTVTYDDLSEPDLDSDQLGSRSSLLYESRDQEGSKSFDSTSTATRNISQSSNAEIFPTSESQCNTDIVPKSLKCNVCGKVFKPFSDPLAFKRHMAVHLGEKPYSCKTCGKSFTKNSTLLGHMRVHTGEKLYSCETCGNSFTRKGNLLVHMRIHSGEKPYVCNACGERFCYLSALKKHKAVRTGEKPYSCKTCGKGFTERGNLLVHMKIHSGERPYTCKTCGKSFTTNSTLLGHMRVHTGGNLYSCETCGNSFTRKGNLLVHMRIHSGEKPYVCNACGERFCYLSALKKHKAVHTDEKPYSCKTCGKGFTERGSLLVHMRIHSGKRPYTCKTCGKSFTTKCTLLVHMRIHTGEKPYSCKICGMSFSKNGGLLVHMKTHTAETLKSDISVGKDSL
uniref:zinc finger protein 271 n=1 Tax=Maylandia zebra TaxID=106582 RepID=UPI000D3087A4|nr:zinc finger protein 271-like [Maylandia zebra]